MLLATYRYNYNLPPFNLAVTKHYYAFLYKKKSTLAFQSNLPSSGSKISVITSPFVWDMLPPSWNQTSQVWIPVPTGQQECYSLMRCNVMYTECGQCLAHSWTTVKGGTVSMSVGGVLLQETLVPASGPPPSSRCFLWGPHLPPPPPPTSAQQEAGAALGLSTNPAGADRLLSSPGEQAQQVDESHQPWAEEWHAGHQAEEFAGNGT